MKKLWRYVKPFSSDTGTLRTDGHTDGQTDLLYQYRASVCWRAIKLVCILEIGWGGASNFIKELQKNAVTNKQNMITNTGDQEQHRVKVNVDIHDAAAVAA